MGERGLDKRQRSLNASGAPSLLDIYRDLLIISHGQYVELLPPEGLRAWLLRMAGSFRFAVGTLLEALRTGARPLIQRDHQNPKIWLFIASGNNYRALQFLRHRLPSAGFVGLFRKTNELGDFARVNLSSRWKYWYRLPWLLIKLWPDYGSNLWRRPDALFKSIGAYETACEVLAKTRPRAIIFANDHIPEMRAFLWAGRSLGIPTIYIQHASVSPYFPPLRFDLNLLEGQDSLEKYQSCGPVEGKVKLIGMPSFDPFVYQRRKPGPVRRIAVCGNLIDEVGRTEALLRKLTKDYPGKEIAYRPHPRDERSITLPPEVKVSNPRNEKIFDFLSHADLLIAGDTSTHLEAILLNLPSIYFPMHDLRYDYYGYVTKGLVEAASDWETLRKIIARYFPGTPNVFLRARPYNAAVGTDFDGKSREIALEAIQAYLQSTNK